MNNQEHIKKVLLYILLVLEILIATFICFYKIGVINIEEYDEARHGINAYEMLKNNNYIVNTYCYETDYWNLKPPLSYWFIIICYKIFGYNLFGLRAYSGISFLAMYSIIILFMKKRIGSIPALLTGWFILSLYILTDGHLTRYGDADSLYSLFYIGAFISLISSDKNKKMFIVSGLCFSLAFLTKSYHAATILISTLVYLLTDKRYKMYSKRDYLGYILAVIIPIAIWMISRFSQDGFKFFVEAVRVDALNRSTKNMTKPQSHFYYLHNMLGCFKVLFLITGISLVLSAIYKKITKFNTITYALLIWIVIPFLLFSVVKGKLAWYVYPEYFMICMLLAIIFAQGFKINNNLILVFSVALCLLPGYYICANITNVLNWEQNADKEQCLIFNNISRTEKYSEKKFYVLDGQQSICLLVELYGDMLYTEGSIDDFINDDSNAYLFISNTDYNKNFEKLNDTIIIDKNEGSILLKKE